MNDQISDGAAMLIARIKTHPTEFSTGGRLRYLVDRATRVANRQDTSMATVGMATVDAVAICEAMQSLYKQELQYHHQLHNNASLYSRELFQTHGHSPIRGARGL